MTSTLMVMLAVGTLIIGILSLINNDSLSVFIIRLIIQLALNYLMWVIFFT